MGRQTRYNKLTDPESISQICKFNMDLKNDFLDYLKSIKRSDGTRAQYDNDLKIFFVWVLNNLDNKKFTDITKRELVRFQNWLVEENESSPARIRRIKATISSLSNYIENILDEDEEFEGFRSSIKKIESPALQPVREKTVWSEEEIDKLLEELTLRKKYEQACYVALAAYSGRRKSELARFKVSDFDEDKLTCEGALYKSEPILTKGGKMLECYTLAKKFKPYLDAWVSDRSAKEIDSIWLFPDTNDRSKCINTGVFDGWARMFSRITGRYFYPHSLRHYFCSSLITAGIPDNVIVEIIGWSSSEMLKIYDDTSKDFKLSMYFKDGDIYVPESKGLSGI